MAASLYLDTLAIWICKNRISNNKELEDIRRIIQVIYSRSLNKKQCFGNLQIGLFNMTTQLNNYECHYIVPLINCENHKRKLSLRDNLKPDLGGGVFFSLTTVASQVL